MSVPEISVEELCQKLLKGVSLIDVREWDEFVTERVPTARYLPQGEIADRVDEIPDEGPVYLICARGNRSRAASEYLRSLGFDAINVAGGTQAWSAAGFEVETGSIR